MSILSRAALASLPRILQAQLEELDAKLSATSDTAETAVTAATEAQAAIDQGNANPVQPYSALLEAISELAGQSGLIAAVDSATAAVYPLGGFIRFLGIGPTSGRPASPSPGVYFDTTLSANGKPVWWNTSHWVDATGAIA